MRAKTYDYRDSAGRIFSMHYDPEGNEPGLKIVTQVEGEQETPVGLACQGKNWINWVRSDDQSEHTISFPTSEKLPIDHYNINLKNNFVRAWQEICQTSLGKVAKEQIDDYFTGKNISHPTLNQVQDYMNSLRLGTPFEQALFLNLRKEFIERGYMADPFELTIPKINVGAFVEEATRKDPVLMDSLLICYQSNMPGEPTDESFIGFLNSLKTASPMMHQLFLDTYAFLAKNGYLRTSALSLADDQLSTLEKKVSTP